MATQTTLIAPTHSGGLSADFVVGSTPLKVSIYSDGASVAGSKAMIEEKNPLGTYAMFAPYGGYVGVLDQYDTTYTIKAPGTYRISLSMSLNKTGVFIEDAP